MRIVRWLCRQIVIGQILDSIFVILSCLKLEYQQEEPSAAYLYPRIANVYFLSYLSLIYDVLHVFAGVQRWAQGNKAFVGNLKYQLTTLKSTISRYCDPRIGGPRLTKMVGDIRTGITMLY